jgi:hypothetical protein
MGHGFALAGGKNEANLNLGSVIILAVQLATKIPNNRFVFM